MEARGWPDEPADWGNRARESDAIVALLDLPAPGQVLRQDEPLFVAGWAVPAGGPVSRIDVFCDGTFLGAARLAYPREDVAGRYGLAHARLSGFDLRCDAAPLLGADTVHLEVVAHGLAGQRWVIAAGDWPVAQPVGPAPFSLLVATHALPYGGSTLWLSEFLERTGAGRDFPCTVVSMQPGPLETRLRELGIAVHVTGEAPLHDPAALEAWLERLAAWARPLAFTSLLANTFFTFPMVELARRLAIPTAWAIHESWSPSILWSDLYAPDAVHPSARQLATAALRQCEQMIFVADATRALFEHDVDDRRATVVRTGIRTARIRDYCAAVDRSTARRQLGVRESARLLLTVGSIEPRKAQTHLALAMAEICARHPDVELALIGGSGSPFEVGLHGFLIEAGLADRVHVLPVTPDVLPWYRATDALVCASDIESLPLSVLEGMAFGLPVVATSAFGLSELLTDERTGLLFPPRDLAAMVDALDRLLTLDPQELRRIADAGQELVLRDYDSAGYASTILSLLRRLSSRSPVTAPTSAPPPRVYGPGRTAATPRACAPPARR